MSVSSAERYENVVTYLDALYGDAVLFEHAGIKHPLVVHEAPSEQITDIDSVCGRLDDAVLSREQLTVYNYAHLHSLQNSKRNTFNGVTFVYQRLRQNPLRLDAVYGQYFDMLATCAALDAELMDAAVTPFVRLPLRSQYHRQHDPMQSLKQGKGRSAAIGGAILVVFRAEDGYRCMLIRRSRRNALNSGFFHVIPAFIFQPAIYPAQAYEWRFSYHVWRELLEELFAVPETLLAGDEKAVMQHPAIVGLQQMIDSGDAGLYLSCVAFNLLTLRPEICGVLLIHDEAWYTGIQNNVNVSAESDHDLILLPIEDEAVLATLPPDAHTSMPPQATAALWTGLKLARKLIAER